MNCNGETMLERNDLGTVEPTSFIFLGQGSLAGSSKFVTKVFLSCDENVNTV